MVLDEARRGASGGGNAQSQPAQGEVPKEEDAPHCLRGSHRAQDVGALLQAPGNLSIFENNEAPSVSVEAEPDSTRAAVLPGPEGHSRGHCKQRLC